MKCPRCKNSNIKIEASTFMKSKSRSLLWNLLWIVVTGGLWIIWMLVRKKKEKQVTVKMAICQDCGHSWKI